MDRNMDSFFLLLRDCTEIDLKEKACYLRIEARFFFFFFVNKDFAELEHTAVQKKKGNVIFYFVNITVLRGNL